MALPSQSARSDGRRSHMFRRRHFARLPIVLGAAALLAGGAWLLIQSIVGDPRIADASPISNEPAQPDSSRTALAQGDFGQPRSPSRAGDSENAGPGTGSVPAPPPQFTSQQQQERQAELAQAGDRLRAASNNAPPAGAQTPNMSQSPARGPGNQPVPAAPSGAARGTDGESTARQQLSRGLEILDSDPLQARRLLTAALDSGALAPEDDENVRMALAHLSDRLIFGRIVHPQDSFARTYKVKSDDVLGKIVKDLDMQVDWRFLLRINGMKSDRSLRAGQDLKIITGPFHAVIDKSDYRLDLYLGEGDERIFVRSFKIGLGEYDSTPAGMFRVGVKAENPAWVNPRDPREKYGADDPDNPLGDHWLALIGIDDMTRDFTGYGIHGTIQPDSIGKQQSMGCVRMLPEDVKLIYEVLMTDVSLVEIRN